uniref:PAZ domain-containing protein n=1 Tax=Globodera rostochiensis TaxID=31243 RepID=A0A914IDZ3_GLORO
MVLFIEFCSDRLECPPKSLRDRLNHPEDRVRVLSEVIGRKVRTTYNDRNGMKKTFYVGGITEFGAAFTQAYGRMKGPYNVNVAAYFYTRHRIKLHHPYVPCIIEKFNGNGEDRFYPMELIELVDEQKDGRSKGLFGHLFAEHMDIEQCSERSISSTPGGLQLRIDDDEAEGCGRDECTQPSYARW